MMVLMTDFRTVKTCHRQRNSLRLLCGPNWGLLMEVLLYKMETLAFAAAWAGDQSV